MLDFLIISYRSVKKDKIEVYPKFIIKKSSDLMIRGGDFYAIWIEELGLWSTDEDDVIKMVDKELDNYLEKHKKKFDGSAKVMYMWDAGSGSIDAWHKYCQKQMRDSFHPLDEKLIFANTVTKKKDYASKKLSYPLEKGDFPAYETLISTLYSKEERHKIEWCIGAIVNGDSKKLQKFLVLYGSAGTGKSTVLNIIQLLFEGYYSTFDAKALGSSSNMFALESFKTNPLVAIQHDGDLSRIEDNTRLNSLVSHELMTVNMKFKPTYDNRFISFLFMGTNKPVKITDAKSGLIRRLIDVAPSGNKLKSREYKQAIKQIEFELGAIAWHCKEVYEDNPGAYDDYIPLSMLGATNDFFNFVEELYFTFKEEGGTSLKSAWETYNTYCKDANVLYPFSKRVFKEELRNYFIEYKDRHTMSDGTRVRNYYEGFRTDKFESNKDETNVVKTKVEPIEFIETKSIFDKDCADCLAQYANTNGIPNKKWSKVTSKLSDLDTSKLHYVKVPENHIIIDFDIPDGNGNKCLEKNVDAASKWPATYAELSKSGAGVHLHYIYKGDVSKLSRIYDDHIEVKVQVGDSSLRRKLSKCNNLPISTISSGLPLKGEKKMVDFEAIKSEKSLRTLIKRNLNKEYHASTKPSVDFIYKILDDAYNGDVHYDVSDMRNAILAFAINSTHQSDYCVKLVSKMKFKSEEPSTNIKNDDSNLIFYDIEVFPNLFIVNWKVEGEDKQVVRMINPKPVEIEELIKYRLVGFNCRRYDNHLLYARLMGYNNEQLYNLSQKIISGNRSAFFGEAYNISYTDVYDFCSKKQSLKKWEIELGIHHQELGLPWDKPVTEELWEKVAEYCDNDVIATEAVFNARKSDFVAREILADVAGMSVNDTTNTLTTRIIFGDDKKPQEQFNYRDLGQVSLDDNFVMGFDEFTRFNSKNQPVFPGYKFDYGKSTYRDEEVSEGGYVHAKPGMYVDVALLDIASMHPSSIENENLFGKYTARFSELKQARVAIKRKEFDKAKKMLGGVLAKYLKSEETASDLAQALKIAINSVYGLTSAHFENPFRDPRNKDNIVAKRGALFMINLKHEVKKRGFMVAHIKTDSIKIPNATPEIIKFVMEYGKLYGYEFEHEATYDRMCLVNDAVYIAKYNDKHEFKLSTGEKINTEWTATGTQFQVPYVFKKLFSRSDVKFRDMCETKSVTTALYLDMNEGLPDVTKEEKELAKINKDLRDGESNLSSEQYDDITSKLTDTISKGHDYIFVGKVGQFCPIKEGHGGGMLCREKDGKYHNATGAKGYRWLESEMVKALNKEEDIDKSYYNKMVDEAVETISKYGDFEWFVSEEPVFTNENFNIKSDPLPESLNA